MSKFESPIEFDTKKKNDNIELSYVDLMEISQGGPEVGTTIINGNPISNYYFGGPCLLHDRKIYIPVYVKKFFKSGFRLAKITTETLNVEFIGGIKDLIFLDKVSNDKIYYFEDMDKTISGFYELNSK